MKFNKRKICQAVLTASALGSIALASQSATAQVVLGGGSSLVGPSIQTEISNFNPNPGSLTYFTDSSGAGQTAFLMNQATALVSIAVVAGVTTTLTASGTADFANSDAALSGAQITAYNSPAGLSASDGPLIQIPFIVTPITIPYVNGPTATTDTFKGPSTTALNTPSLALNDNDLCGIFSGKLTNWNKVVNPDTGATFSVNAPITVVYRSDNSGTSDLLTRHLQQVCTTGTSGNSNVSFVETQAFLSNFAGGVAPTSGGASFVGASGSGGVQAALLALSGAGVAYLSPDWTNTFLAPSSPSASHQLAVASLVNSAIVNSPLGTADIAPTFGEADAAVATATASVPTSKPQASKPALWVPDSATPSVGYPVSGTSQIILSQCYANSNVAGSLVNFLNDHYGTATGVNAKNFSSIINNNGFDIPSAYVTQIQDDFLSNANGFNLDINDSAVCTTPIAGR